MSYKLPSPSVRQILNRASQPLADSDLLPCIVGPLKQSVMDADITVSLPVSTSITIPYIDLKPGALIDAESVKINIYNAIVQVVASTAITSLTLSGKTLSATTAIFLGAKSGDQFKIASNGGTYTIQSVSSDNKSITLLSTPSLPISGNFSVVRTYTASIEAEFDAFLNNGDSFSFSGLLYDGNTIISGNPKLSYVADRSDLTGFYEVSNYDTLKSDIDINYKNPLGYYIGILALAANGGRKVLAYITKDDSDMSYLEALDDLSTRRDAYSIVSLSNSSTIKNAIAAHVVSMSDPSISYFRTTFLPAPDVSRKTLATINYLQS